MSAGDPPDRRAAEGDVGSDAEGGGRDGAIRSGVRDTDPGADEWLISHAVRGDVRAYEELVRRHQDRVYRIAYRMLGNRHDAEDVAQDVLLQLWVSLASFAGSASFTTWLYRLVVNRTISTTRRRHRQVEQPHGDDVAVDQAAAGAPVPSSEDSAVAGEQSQAIASAVSRLDPDLRSVFVLRHFEGLSYSEIGEVLRLPEPTVRGRLARGRQQLTTSLKEWR